MAGAVLRLAVWAAILSGLLEGLLWILKRQAVQPITFQSPETIWAAPISYLCVYLPLGVVLAFLQRRWPRAVSLPTCTFLLAFLSGWSLLMVFKNQLHWIAMLALALGGATQLARMTAARPALATGLVRRTVVWLALLVPMIMAARLGGRAWAERRAMHGLADPAPGTPNVLLVVLDAVRASNLSLHGYPRPTSPGLERLAARGARFDLAVATAPWTLPSHAGMFTGRYPQELSADWGVPLDGAHRTLAEELRGRGYATAGFVANFSYASAETGLARGFVRYDDFPVLRPLNVLTASVPARLVFSHRSPLGRLVRRGLDPSRKSAHEIAQALLEWTADLDGRPFFAFVNLYDAHDPYVPPAPFRGRFDSDDPRAPRAPEISVMGDTAERRRVRRLLDRYDESIAAMDSVLAALVDSLDRRGTLLNTVLIVTSDHGEEFGEHGLFEHGKSLYFPALHVPLVVVFPPRIPGGVSVAAPVSLRDLPATVMELSGLAGDAFPGATVVRFLRGDGADSSGEAVMAEVGRGYDLPPLSPALKGAMRSALLGRYHLIRGADGTEEIFDILDDPFEQKHLPAPADTAALARLRDIVRPNAPVRQ